MDKHVYAKIFDGVVDSVSLQVPRKRIVVDGELQIVDDLDGWAVVPKGVFCGFTDNGDGTFSPPDPDPVNVEQVKDEAQRRILALTNSPDIMHCLIKQQNLTARGVELARKEVRGGLTSGEQEEVRELETIFATIRTIRIRCAELEETDELPADYTDNKHWA